VSNYRNTLRACAVLFGTSALTLISNPAWAAPDDHADTATAADVTGASADEIVVAAKGANASAVVTREQARSIQKAAPNIVDIASQEEIKQMPNFVLGDAARRLPGAAIINKSGEARSIQIRGVDPNLNGITYEGVLLPAGSINSAGRAVPLDAIPAALVGGLELIKTNAPAQEATALGGQLNILSRDIARGDPPFLNVTAAGGFRQPHPLGIFQGTISGGMRFGLHGNPFDRDDGSRKPFAISFFATDISDRMMLDNIQQTFADKSTLPANTLSKAQRIEYVQSKRRRGYGGTASWDVDDNTTLYFKGFASGIDYHPTKYQQLYTFANPVFSSSKPGTYTATTTLGEAMNDNLVHDDERLYKFGGASKIGKLTVDYYGAYASNRLYSPYSYTGTLTSPTTTPFLIDNVTSPQLPTMTSVNGVSASDYSADKLSGLSNLYQDDRDANWSGHIGVSAPLDLGPLKGVLSAGGGLRREKVTHNDVTTTYTGLPSLNGQQLTGTASYTIFDGAYHLGTPLSAAAIRELFNGGSVAENVAADAITNRQAALNDNENVYNGYIQYSANWNKLGVLAGVRYEATRGVYRGTATSVVSGVTTLAPRTVRQNYDNVFPTVQLRYAISDDLIARANWSTAIGRPGFSQLTATQTVNFSSGTVTQGNPGLKPTTGNNYDVSLEYYLPLDGIVSIGGFDKEFRNYVVSTTTNGTFPGITGNAIFSTYANIPHASVRGFELNYSQQFTFLPGMLSGLGVGGNFTYVVSRGAKRAGVVETLAYTSPQVFNVQAFYRRGPVSLQLAGNFESRTMTSLGSTPALDSYVQPFLNFDVDARFAITRRLTVFFQGRNVTNEKQVATEGKSAARYTEIQYFGSSYLFGVDLKL
jgi:TonB-dependent receptor